jgi:2-phospho-L-lactate/phosphoenolpyruvate guanylyltransferase
VSAGAGSCIALIPAKLLHVSKSRLAGVLQPRDRERLVEAMLRHVIETALAADAVDAVVMLGRRSPAFPALDVIEDPGGGLNAALRHALLRIAERGVDRMLVVAGDLPLLVADELDRLASIVPGSIGIAPDRHGTGTNALSLPLPAAINFRFAYGPGSFALHRAEAARIGHDAIAIRGTGLARDVDDPADLLDADAIDAKPSGPKRE